MAAGEWIDFRQRPLPDGTEENEGRYADFIAQADYIIDLGPEGGDEGGTIVAEGPLAEAMKHPGSHTAHYLAQRLGRKDMRKPPPANGKKPKAATSAK